MRLSFKLGKFLPAALVAAVLLLGYPQHDASFHIPPAQPLVTSEVVCLAQTIFFEARGEPQDSRLGVALVVMNRSYEITRIGDESFFDFKPLSICSVVHKKIHGRCAFSYYCLHYVKNYKFRSEIDRRSWNDSVILARYVENCYNVCMVDITLGATFYDSNKAHAAWENGLVHTVSLGHHEFFRAN